MQWILSLISAPFFNLLLKGYQAKLEAAGKSGAQAADVAKSAMVAEVQSRAETNKIIAIEYGRWWTALPRWVIEASVATYVGKAIFWDNVWMGGASETPAIHGDVGLWIGMVIAFWFGTAGVKGAIATARSLWR